MSISTSRNSNLNTPILILPRDLQVNILTFLRAYDLSALQKTCTFYAQPELIDNVISHFAENIYPSQWTKGFASSSSTITSSREKIPPVKRMAKINNLEKTHYTFEDLRNMELLVVARVLNSPEPASGFFISKSWCKTALRWLEIQQEQNQKFKKLSRKKQRVRDRKLSDASPPWSNANIDLLCQHQNLQCCNGKSARARRRLLDRQAWKILTKLYPDSTQLESCLGECLQCTAEAETIKKNETDRLEQAKMERKRPLANEEVRRFYTRRTGVPSQSIKPTASLGQCPLMHGNYYIITRAWCHAWRKYIKTGEGGLTSPPDASSLLCHAHRLALVPPHLERYLYGETIELLNPFGEASSTSRSLDATPVPERNTVVDSLPAAPVAVQALIPGQGPDPEALEALRAAGLGSQISLQISMIREHEENNRQEVEDNRSNALHSSTTSTKNELLDSENYTVVEILSEKEYLALESCWTAGHGFGLCFTVDETGVTFLTTQTCRECDATGRQHSLHMKNRSRRAIRKNAEKTRAPASLEY